jgi:hypothetical protein
VKVTLEDIEYSKDGDLLIVNEALSALQERLRGRAFSLCQFAVRADKLRKRRNVDKTLYSRKIVGTPPSGTLNLN